MRRQLSASSAALGRMFSVAGNGAKPRLCLSARCTQSRDINDDASPKSEKITPVIRAICTALMSGKRCCGPTAPYFNDLTQDRHGNLGRSLGADVEADRRIDFFDQFLRDLVLIAKSLKASLDAPPAADHADVFRLGRQHHSQAW